MLRTWLLATTVFVAVGSVAFSSGEAGGADNRASTLQTGMELGSPGRDRNRDFLCTYGYHVYYDAGRESGYSWVDWRHYAVPITGKGASVTEIVVTDSPDAGSSGFAIGIYGNANGRPGGMIVGGKGKAKGSCILTTVAIPSTFLVAGKKYWVVEDAPHRAAPAAPMP